MMEEGGEGLLRLATGISFLTLSDIRTVHSLKAKILKPLAPEFEKYKEQADSDPYELEPGFFKKLADSTSVYRDIEACLASYAAYCRFVNPEVLAVQQFGSMPPNRPCLYREARKDFVDYCTSRQYNFTMPRTWTRNEEDHTIRATSETIPRMEVLDMKLMWFSTLFKKLDSVLCNFWAQGELTSIEDSDNFGLPCSRALTFRLEGSDLRLWIFRRVALHDGWPTLQLLQPGGLKRGRARLEKAKQDVLALTEEQLQTARLLYKRREGWISMMADTRS